MVLWQILDLQHFILPSVQDSVEFFFLLVIVAAKTLHFGKLLELVKLQKTAETAQNCFPRCFTVMFVDK